MSITLSSPRSSNPNAKHSDAARAMLKYLLDTHIAIHVIKRRPIDILVVFNEYAGRIAISPSR